MVHVLLQFELFLGLFGDGIGAILVEFVLGFTLWVFTHYFVELVVLFPTRLACIDSLIFKQLSLNLVDINLLHQTHSHNHNNNHKQHNQTDDNRQDIDLPPSPEIYRFVYRIYADVAAVEVTQHIGIDLVLLEISIVALSVSFEDEAVDSALETSLCSASYVRFYYLETADLEVILTHADVEIV